MCNGILLRIQSEARWHNSIQSQVHKCLSAHSYNSKVFASVNVASGNICVEHSMPMEQVNSAIEAWSQGWIWILDIEEDMCCICMGGIFDDVHREVVLVNVCVCVWEGGGGVAEETVHNHRYICARVSTHSYHS